MAGIIATKVGMSRVFSEDGTVVPVTYLRVDPNVVVRTRTKERDGYNALVLGIAGRTVKTRKGKQLTRYRIMKEFLVESLDGVEVGKSLGVESIPVESTVTVSGTSKGKGFQGVVKRHGFAGGPKTHGSHFKREPGSVGMRNKPGKILKGHRMAGRMGGDRITLQHRPIVAVDAAQNLLAVGGAVPGPNGSFVTVVLESSPTS